MAPNANTVLLPRWVLVGWLLAQMAEVIAAPSSEDVVQSYSPDGEASSIAAGYTRKSEVAPSITTVISADEFRALGARTLAEALESVPGVHVSNSRGLNSIVSIRGIFSELSPHVLVMVDGIPLSQGFVSPFSLLSELQVNTIERVEIIRGPGSALYGADAFSGVINVVTRATAGYNGTEVGARAGYFDTYEAWLLHGSKWGPVDVGVSLAGSTSSGYERTIRADAQTALDEIFGTQASLAPGPLNAGRDNVDLRLRLSTEDLRLRLNYFRLFNAQNGAGASNALDPVGSGEASAFNADLVYQKMLTPDLEVSGTLSILDTVGYSLTRHLPPGTLGGLFPDGVLDDISINGQQRRAEATAVWSPIRHHVLRGGVGFYDLDVLDLNQKTNSRTVVLFNGVRSRIPTGRFADVSEFGIETGIPARARQVYYFFAQDEWRLRQDWTLTTGVRTDVVSDVGTAANPRAALVREIGRNASAKLMYGRAFRPFNLVEGYARSNNLSNLGNPNLRAETIDTLEASVSGWGHDFRTELNAFGYWIHDPIVVRQSLISPGLSTFENGPAQTGYGLETAVTWDVFSSLRLKLNYSFQESLDRTANSLGTGPRHQVFSEIVWTPRTNCILGINTKSLIGRDRSIDDPRDPISDYTVVNLSLQLRNVLEHLDLTLSARNVLNEDARDPSIGIFALRDDYPLAGQNFWAEARVHF